MEPGYCDSCQGFDGVVTLCVLHAGAEGLLEAAKLAVRALLGEVKGEINVLDTLEAAIEACRKTDLL
jgi:hypothetical protein